MKARAKKWQKDNVEKSREISNKKFAKTRDRHYTVYYLPEEHYVGKTYRYKARLKEHDKSGKIIEGAEIVWITKSPAMANLMEAYLHTFDYNGVNIY